MPKIFLSHASPHKHLAGEFYGCLKSIFDVFMAEESIEMAEDWAKRIGREIEQRDVFIALVSWQWETSEWCQREYLAAKRFSKKIIPIYAAYCPYRSYDIWKYEGIVLDDSGPLEDVTNSPLEKRINEAVGKLKRFFDAASATPGPRIDPRIVDYAVPNASSGKAPTPLIIHHCGLHTGEHAPGMQLQEALEELLGYSIGPEGRHDVTKDGGTPSPKPGQTIFIVDSPTANPVARDVLLNYQRYIVGTKIRHVTTLARGIQVQTILAGRDAFSSNRHEVKFDDRISGAGFDDYLVLMRLPGIVLEGDFSEAAAENTVWLLYGTTQRGSFAGASVFLPKNLPLLLKSLTQPTKTLPSAFQAVFHVLKGTANPEDFADLGERKLMHVLTSLQDSIRGDPVPPHVGRDLFYRDEETRGSYVPISAAHLDLVAACNFECPGCIEHRLREMNCRLSFKKATTILRELRDQGCQKLSFYGGEPTLHPDFLEIVEQAVSRGFKPLVVTNGSRLIDEKLAAGLQSLAGSVRLRVSIDADSQGAFVKQHGPKSRNYSFDDIRDAVRALAESVNVGVSYLVTETNVGELAQAIRFWKERSKVAAFIPRVPMAEHGRWCLDPRLGAAIRDQLKSVPFDEWADWLVMPDWLLDRIRDDQLPNDDWKPDLVWGFSECYSAYYRIVISPRLKSDSQRDPDGEPVETEEAWISLCPYQRYEDQYGCWYPTKKTLKDWCETDRRDLVDAIQPRLCARAGVVCSRIAHNAAVQAEVNLLRSRPRRAPAPRSA